MHFEHALTLQLACSYHASRMHLPTCYPAVVCVRQAFAVHAQNVHALHVQTCTNKSVVSVALPASSQQLQANAIPTAYVKKHAYQIAAGQQKM